MFDRRFYLPSSPHRGPHPLGDVDGHLFTVLSRTQDVGKHETNPGSVCGLHGYIGQRPFHMLTVKQLWECI